MTPDPATPQNDQAAAAPGIPPVPQKPRDMSQSIRTYAKEVAMLTHQPVPESALATDFDRTQGVGLPEGDESPVNRPGGVVRDFPQETLTVSREDAADVFHAPPLLPEPVAAAPEFQPPVGPSEEERRESILARLRERVVTHAPAATPVQPPVAAEAPPAPEPEPLPEPEPFGPPLPRANLEAYRMTRPLDTPHDY